MSKLRLIRPWRLQTRRQRTGYDGLEITFRTVEATPCTGPQDDGPERGEVRKQGLIAGIFIPTIAPSDFYKAKQKERGLRI